MARHTIGLGALLVILGVGTFGLLGFNFSSWTPLIPAVMGVPFLILGALALDNEGRQRGCMYASVALAFFIFLMMAPTLIQVPALFSGQVIDRPLAVLMQAVVALLLAGYILTGVQSVIEMYRNQEAAT